MPPAPARPALARVLTIVAAVLVVLGFTYRTPGARLVAIETRQDSFAADLARHKSDVRATLALTAALVRVQCGSLSVAERAAYGLPCSSVDFQVPTVP